MDGKFTGSSAVECKIKTKGAGRLSRSCDRKPSGVRKRSLSKTFQNMFHQRRSYSVKEGHLTKGKKLYDSINNADGVNVDYIPFRRSSKARVWSVRNSFSKSPVETVSHDLLKFSSPAKVRKKTKKGKTCSNAFDILNSFNDLILANEENVVIKPSKKLPRALRSSKDETNLTVKDNLAEDADYSENFDEEQDRSRLPSFGSSASCSNVSGTCSLSGCSHCNLDRSDIDSVAMENDVNTSYWDLRLPTETSFRMSGRIPRRYSLSFVTEHQRSIGSFGSPEIRTYLAKRRSSEQPSGMSRNNNFISWQDKFLHAVGNENFFNDGTEDVIMQVGEGKLHHIDVNTKKAIDIPRSDSGNQVRRSRSACGDMKRSQSVHRNYRVDEVKDVDRMCIHRSRSVDDSKCKRKTFHSRERKASRSSTCQFAFSDIESSEESESSRDPKETSSEERHPSSNDSSSLSACSMSGSSNNEHSVSDGSKQEITYIGLSSTEAVQLNDFGVNADFMAQSDISMDSLNSKNIDKEVDIDLDTPKSEMEYAEETDEKSKGNNMSILESYECKKSETTVVSDKCNHSKVTRNIVTELPEQTDEGYEQNVVGEDTSAKSVQNEYKTENENATNEHMAEAKIVEDEFMEEAKSAQNENMVEAKDALDKYMEESKNAQDEYKTRTKTVQNEYDAEAKNVQDEYMMEAKDVQDEYKPDTKTTQDNCKNTDLGNLLKNVTEQLPEDDLGTDVDLLFQEKYEDEDFCLDILFSELKTEGSQVEIVDYEMRPEISSPIVRNFEEIGQSFKTDDAQSSDVDTDKINLINFDVEIETVTNTQDIDRGGGIKESEHAEKAKLFPVQDLEKRTDDDSYPQDCGDCELNDVLDFFDSVLSDVLEPDNQLEEMETDKQEVDLVTVVEAYPTNSDDTSKECDESVEDECRRRKLLGTEDLQEETSDKQFSEVKHCVERLVVKENCDEKEGHEDEMTDESVQVEDLDELKIIPELHERSLEEILMNSGNNPSDIDVVDDIDGVFEAINREANKEGNKDKDMTVLFIVGGELKVIRRSGTILNGSHGEGRQQDIPSMTRKESPQQNGRQEYVHKRPIHDINRGRPKSAIIVTRSQSFHGMANQPVGMGGKRESPQAVVLGESFRHHRTPPPMQVPRATPGSRGAVGFSFKKSPKVPKVPRPNRALLMFHSVKRGVREFIDATKEDVNQLQHRETDHTSTAQGRLHEADKQIKSAERYLKRLEFHLAKLDELHEYYILQQQLREGVRTMHRAYTTSPGNQTHSLANVKYGYKECTQTMCNIEAQLEAMMGTFNCKLKGMAGFARLCPGDVFEVTVRHGTQKWKTKGRIEKTGNQKWDVPEFNFKAVVGDIFNIKGLEVRAFKSVLLGQKSCETKDLFSANPQLMTVSINVNGSLKLSIVITWNPLDGVEESFNFMEAPQRAQGTPRRRPVSVIALNGQYEVEPGVERPYPTPVSLQQTKDDNFILRTNAPTSRHVNNVTSYHGLDSPQVSARLSEHLPDAYRQTGPIHSQTSHHIQAGFHSSPAFPVHRETDSDKMLPHPPTQNSAFSNSFPTVMGHLHFPSVSPHAVSSAKEEEENTVLNIEDVLHTLTSSLEDYHGQYAELQKLEDLVKFAHKLIRKQFRSSSRSSSISVSIESALEAFDFLDTEDAFEEPRSPANNVKASFDDMLCSPESTAKTGDSGIESLAQRLSEDTQLGSSLGSSPVPPSTGNEEVDQCLMYHLTYCERLLENLGAFGPLKCREIYALDKLQKQCKIVESLLKLAKSGPHVDLHSVMSYISDEKTLKEFWVKCTDQNSLYIHPDRLLNMLEQKYSSVIAERHMMDPVKVCQHVITRVLDVPDYEAERGRSWFVLTLHQFMLYFNEEGGLKHIEDVAEEMKLVEKLTSGNPDIVIKAILTLRDTLPSSPCLKVIGMLLVTMNTEVEQCTLSYLNLIQKKKENREKALVTFVEGLEDRTPEIRSGACAALAILEGSESLDQLVYLWQSDSAPMVQKSAKQALLSLGEDGRKAFEDAQLSKHGFQGIQVHK